MTKLPLIILAPDQTAADAARDACEGAFAPLILWDGQERDGLRDVVGAWIEAADTTGSLAADLEEIIIALADTMTDYIEDMVAESDRWRAQMDAPKGDP